MNSPTPPLTPEQREAQKLRAEHKAQLAAEGAGRRRKRRAQRRLRIQPKRKEKKERKLEARKGLQALRAALATLVCCFVLLFTSCDSKSHRGHAFEVSPNLDSLRGYRRIIGTRLIEGVPPQFMKGDTVPAQPRLNGSFRYGRSRGRKAYYFVIE